jgi:hypothetical protein
VNAALCRRALFPRIMWPLAMLRTAFDCGINGTLESLPSVWVQLDFRFFRVKRFF